MKVSTRLMLATAASTAGYLTYEHKVNGKSYFASATLPSSFGTIGTSCMDWAGIKFKPTSDLAYVRYGLPSSPDSNTTKLSDSETDTFLSASSSITDSLHSSIKPHLTPSIQTVSTTLDQTAVTLNEYQKVVNEHVSTVEGYVNMDYGSMWNGLLKGSAAGVRKGVSDVIESGRKAGGF